MLSVYGSIVLFRRGGMVKYYKTKTRQLYYKVDTTDKTWWYWDSVRWTPSLTLWKPRKYKPFIIGVSELEILVVLGPKAAKE